MTGPQRLLPVTLMLGASACFALMGVFVKFASSRYSAGEVVFYRSLVGVAAMGATLRLRGVGLGTAYPGMHAWRGLVGTTGLCLWFYAIGGLPLGTAMTLNYMSAVWIALFLIGGAVLNGRDGGRGLDGRLVATVLAGFAGVALVLRPTIAQDQLWHGLIGLLSGITAGMAYLQVTALGRLGEPSERVVFYFSCCGCLFGATLAWGQGGWHAHRADGLLQLLGIGLLATAAQWMLTRAYATGATLGVAALQYLGIVYSVALGAWLFDDPLTPTALTGMALIIAAGVAATLLSGRPTLQHRGQADVRPAPPTES